MPSKNLPTTKGETYYSKRGVAEQFGVSVWTVARLIASGELAATRFGGQLRIPQSAIDTYCAAQTVRR